MTMVDFTKKPNPIDSFAQASSPLAWALGTLAATLILQLPLVLDRAINWDEFYHYAQVQKLAQGTLAEPLQTLYTRAFVWVPSLPGTGVDHIIVIRLFMLACELVTIAAIVGIASRFTNRATAVLCALAYVSASFVFKNGTSFRFDPPAAALLMTSAWILLHRKLDIPAILLTGLLIGTSAVLTIKTVLYAPVFAGVIWLRWVEGGRQSKNLIRLAALGTAVLVFAGLIYLLHSSTLGTESDSEARQLISRAAASMITFGNPLYWRDALVSAATSPILASAALAAPIVIWRCAKPTAEKVALTGMWLPLTTLLFYHNTAAYYYVYMLPPVAVAAGPALSAVAQRYSAAFVGLLMTASAAIILMFEPNNPIDRQRQILQAAERMFPEGVAYFDFCAMLGSFPKANVFMTPWGIEHYLAGHLPNLTEAMAQRPVPLLVNNDWMFEAALYTKGDVSAFLPHDLAAIRETFIPLWGPLWIAGKAIPPRREGLRWNVRVPGPYTVHDGTVTVDGRRVTPGEVITLERGHHVVSTGPKAARLMWGNKLELPTQPAPEEPYFMPF